MISKYEAINIILWWMCIRIVGGGGYSNRNASRDESDESADECVETRGESIEAGGKNTTIML